MSENKLEGIMDVTMDKVRGMLSADTIIGTPVNVGDITLLPVSKISYGVASGGSDFPSKSQSGLFGGGGGAGVSITPVAFVAIHGSDVKMMPIFTEMTAAEKAINLAPELFDKVKTLFSKDKKNSLE